MNPDDVLIPELGVSKKVARQICTGIYADGIPALFNEQTLDCAVPVVAHNWGGIIKKDGDSVVTYVSLGDTFKCSANEFEQVAILQRTSQWVAPLMVVAGGGIGFGIDYAVDTKRENDAKNITPDKSKSTSK
ncbi:hypothetical protein AGMMS4952_27570 [Spirochaetia bacterium]|nr:hypothetical protein AGMMS4952_27570 [Spirochaetia bacterium]